MSISREELYRLVWSKPMTQVAEQFEVSGSYMARVCANLNVPRPPRGYWAKLAVGKAPPQISLPEALPGDQLHWSKGEELPPSPRTIRPAVIRLKSQATEPKKTGMHSLVRGVRELFENGRPVEDGSYLKPYKKLLVDVTASKACLSRALDFANELFNSLESAGCRVVIAPPDASLRRASLDEREVRSKRRDHYYYSSNLWSPYRPTVVYVGEIAVGLAILETSENVLLRYVNGTYIREADYIPPKRSRHYADHTWTTTKELPSGRLRLVTYSAYSGVDWSSEWQEADGTRLNSSIKAITHSIQTAAGGLIPKLEEAERKAELLRQEWAAAEDKRRRDEDRRQAQKAHQDSQDHLRQIIQRWANVMSVEQFLQGVESQAARLSEGDKGPLMERLNRAREFLGTQDPLDFFRSWKTPEERYSRIYIDENETRET